jgi:Sap, sulfolipid-1-addressing protein
MLGHLLGAYTTSITAGLLIVFSLHRSNAENTSKHKISPIEDIIIGVLNLAVAFLLATGLDAGLRRRRQRRQQAKQASATIKTPWSERMLAKGSAKLTFLVGTLLSFPGLAYLDALDHIVKLNDGTAPSMLLVLYFCVMQQILLELPRLGYTFAPKRTRATVTGFKAWFTRSGRHATVIGLTAIGLVLLGRGLYGLG